MQTKIENKKKLQNPSRRAESAGSVMSMESSSHVRGQRGAKPSRLEVVGCTFGPGQEVLC